MKKKKNALLWKISSPTDEIHTSYLFGTMHSAPVSLLPKIENLKPILEKCTYFAAETDINRGQEVAQAVSLLKDTNLRILLGKKKFEKLRKIFLKAYKVDLIRFMDFNPLFLNSVLTKQAFGNVELIAPDELLWSMATELGLKTKGLEPIEKEIEIIRNLPMKYQLNTLKAIGKNISKYIRKLLELTELYAKEDLRGLYQRTMKGSGGMKRVLLYERNEIMTATFLKLSEQAPLFAAVGAAHLPGKQGLLKLLKEKSLSVKPIIMSHEKHRYCFLKQKFHLTNEKQD